MEENTTKEGTWWRLCEVCLDGYSSIMMMLWKAGQLGQGSLSTKAAQPSSDEQLPRSLLMVRVSRRLLNLVDRLLTLLSIPPSVSLVFGLYRSYLAMGCIARRILEEPGDPQSEEDVALFEKLVVGIDRSARGKEHLEPLAKVFRETSISLRSYLRQSKEGRL